MDPILIILILSVTAFIVGGVLDSAYHKLYHMTSINDGMLIFQSLCIVLFAITFPTDDVTIWFMLSISGVIFSYALGLTFCWADAKKIHASKKHAIMEMAAQALLPLGFAIMIIFILQIISGGKNRNQNRRK